MSTVRDVEKEKGQEEPTADPRGEDCGCGCVPPLKNAD